MEKIDPVDFIGRLVGKELLDLYLSHKSEMLAFGDDEDSGFLNYIDSWLSNLKFDIALETYERALKYTPVDTGRLKGSIYLKRYEDGYVIGYNCDYAIYVHELVNNQHKFPTRAKFLEDAAVETMNEFNFDKGVYINLGIQYKPLEVYIGVENQNNLLNLVKRESNNKKIAIEALNELKDDFGLDVEDVYINTPRKNSYWNIKRDRSSVDFVNNFMIRLNNQVDEVIM